jgi:hypothetical protein
MAMHLTGHELTLISSGVAAIAIIGGYLGVRAANRNAVRIAKDERSSKREDELKALKRVVYVKMIHALNALMTACLEATWPMLIRGRGAREGSGSGPRTASACWSP